MSQVAFSNLSGGNQIPGAANDGLDRWLYVSPNQPGPASPFDDSPTTKLRFGKLEAYQRQTRPAELAIATVRALSQYGQGWDGYEAEAPCRHSLRDAVEFLSRTRSRKAFEALLGADGLVTLSVGEGDNIARLTFEGDSRVVVSKKTEGYWSDLGPYSIRGELGRASPEVERMICAS